MGCGQSKIGIIKSKNKRGAAGVEEDSVEEVEEKECGTIEEGENEDLQKNQQLLAGSPGPLLAQTEISSSQMDFFRMLDEKVENGPDYDSANEEEIALERARLCALLKDWETASLNSSSNRPMSCTPVHRKLPARPTQHYHQQLNGDLFLQQTYHHRQYQHNSQPQPQHRQQYIQYSNRGQYMVPTAPQISHITALPLRNYQPPQNVSSIVQYRQPRGAYTELA